MGDARWMTDSEIAVAVAENALLRRLLWHCHGCPPTALYGDDGEMSCGACVIDFKRWPAEAIDRRIKEIARKKMEEAAASGALDAATLREMGQ